MAKEQDPLLTELEKIVLFYTHPFLKALSCLNVDDFDSVYKHDKHL